MDMALYYPGLGYYDSDEDCIGKNGDFVTSPIVSSLFGEMIAMQLEEMWVMLGKKDFTVAEYGAGTGLLCHDIIHQAQKNPEFYNHLHYCVIEKSNSMREKQKKILPRKINWVDQVADIPPFSGCVLSNEVIDNFPVHQVVMEDQLMEVYVNYNGQFSESLQPAAPELINYLDELGIGLPRGYRAEINLAAIQWILRRGL
jgi:SAM-dependent MidA family methyltransferase